MRYDAIILGAGGAGLLAAATAGQAGARVLVLDHADQPGRKILISGGGRCNFTNTGAAPERFLSENPHFAKSALSRYTQWDFLALVERHGIRWHEGEFAYEVSMPAKSGEGGGILGVAPGRASIEVWSPGLNAKGNSAVGTLAMASLGRRTQWSVFGPAEA